MSRPTLDAKAWRELSRALTECAGDAAGITGFDPLPLARPRLGVTGSPGSGKSSLIGALASLRVGAAKTLAVLAIDPTSPISRGSVLGDRIRMDAIAALENVFIRSLPSRSVHDGLCDNIEALLRILERASFGEIILETVGAGQVQHTVRTVTDTLVVVLSPHAGDSIQAMKAGLMEMADIYVVNKSDLPDAGRSAAELRATLKGNGADARWRPPVILASSLTGVGVAELSEAIDRHRSIVVAARDLGETARKRTVHHVGELLQRRLSNALRASGSRKGDTLDGMIEDVLARLRSG